MAVSIGIQQPPLPIFSISAPLALNYLSTPHATLRSNLWHSTSVTLSAPILRTDEAEDFLRFTRTATGAAAIIINESGLQIPAGTFDVRLSVRTSTTETGCTLGLRVGASQVAGDNIAGASFSTPAGGWVEQVATITISAKGNWTLILHLGSGAVSTLIDVKLGAIMPSGLAPFYGDQKTSGTDFYYWESASNGSHSVHARRTLTNAPGPYYTVDNLTTYIITENASPLSPADTTGGATTVQLGVQEFEDSLLLAGGELTVFEAGEAIVQGEITAPTSDGTTVSITSMSIIARMNIVRRVQPFVGSLDGYIAVLLASVGVTRPLIVDVGIAERPVAITGFKDNVLSRVKEFCAVQGVELSDRGDAVYIRLPRQRTLDGNDLTTASLSTDVSQFAQSVEVVNYNSEYVTDALIYPPATYDDSTGTSTEAGWVPDSAILTVDSGAVTTLEVSIQGSMVSVEQPACRKEVGPNDGVLGSVYTVIGQGSAEGTASIETLDPEVWTRLGGSVTVSIGDNFDTIIIKIASGANEPSLGPFAIAMSSGSGTSYSSLRIRGTGIVNHKEKLTYATGLGPSDTTTEVGITIDSPYVQNGAIAARVASETMPTFSRPILTLSGNTDNPGLAPGDIAGARVRYGDSFFRVTTAGSSEAGTTVGAIADTTLDDFDVLGHTFASFDAVWAGRTFTQFGVAPLRLA